MFDELSAESIHADLMMQGSQDDRIFLLLEGDDDLKALDAYIDEDACLVFDCHGRPNVLGAIALANAAGDAAIKVVALVDADLGNGTPDPRITTRNVVCTEYSDLDSEILHVGGLVERLSSTHVDGQALRKRMAASQVSSLLAGMYGIVDPISAARENCIARGHTIATRDFPIVALYQKGKWRLDPSQFLPAIAARCNTCSESEFSDWYSEAPWNSADITRLHNGHHLFSALHAILRVEGKYPGKVDNLERAARAAVSWSDLSRMDFVRELDAWAKGMSGRIWSQDLADAQAA